MSKKRKITAKSALENIKLISEDYTKHGTPTAEDMNLIIDSLRVALNENQYLRLVVIGLLNEDKIIPTPTFPVLKVRKKNFE